MRGINIPDCLCDPGACASVMPYEIYCLLDLGPLRSTKDIFTTADMGIVSIAGIAEDVVEHGGSLPSKETICCEQEICHQVQLSKEDKDERKQSEEAKARLKSKGLRSSPLHVKKKRKDPTKKKVKIRKPREDNSKEKKEEGKEKRRLELKCKSVEDLIGKLYAFKKVLHHNDAMTHHLVKNQSKWK
ncbi:hypothetical protein PIB30_068367 [Stylosanthes scabra]|uniref:Uncharacterized protein n=1 Tax=Stylosanthes scabra TaxID=79078 RepID=A0ABU6YPR2_9FABA|nr:hypothetical protein [Stylosanthes scabra]